MVPVRATRATANLVKYLQPCSCRFHETLPLLGFEGLSQSEACHQTINSGVKSVPYPLLLENTFVISSDMVLNHGAEKAHPCLQFRVG